VKYFSKVGWVSSLFERNPTKNVGLRSNPSLTQPTLLMATCQKTKDRGCWFEGRVIQDSKERGYREVRYRKRTPSIRQHFGKRQNYLNHLLAIICLIFFSVAQANEKVLNIYIWGNYLPNEVTAAFTKETGIRVNVTEFDNNETMYTKLKTISHTGYDLVVPSSFYVPRMIRYKMIQPLDKSKIGGIENLDPILMSKEFDLGNKYSLPYFWGTSGIIINTKYYPKNSITSWSDLWKSEYENKLMILDDMREMFSIAMLLLGYPVNDLTPEHIQKAYLKLKTLLPNIRIFNIDAVPNIYIDEDATIGTVWSGDAKLAEQENHDLQYVLPKEGFAIWIDSIAILNNAPHLENAYKFLNFMLRPDVAKNISLITGNATPNLAARKLLPKAIQHNPISYPDAKTLRNGFFQYDIDDKTLQLLSKYWEKLKIGE